MKKKRKSTSVSTPSVGKQIVTYNGGTLNAGGTPGNKGGGRPPDAFKAMCRELASADKVRDRVIEILENPRHIYFLGALKWASEHGYGSPKQAIEHSISEQTIEDLVAASRRPRAPRE